MFELFSNSALLKRFLSFVGLVPLILRFVERAEMEFGPGTGPAKRAAVLTAVNASVEQLTKRGFMPESIQEGLLKTAGELTDTAVAMYNAAGFFMKEKRDGTLDSQDSD